MNPSRRTDPRPLEPLGMSPELDFLDQPLSLPLRATASTRHDLMALGECMVRLSPPGHGRLEFARSLEIDVGGGE